MNSTVLASVVLGAVLLLSIAIVAWAMLHINALADRAAPLPPVEPDRNYALAHRWHADGALSSAGYYRLLHLMDDGLDANPYWAGDAHMLSACIWAFRRRYVLADWNAESDMLAAAGRHAQDEQGEGQNGGAA